MVVDILGQQTKFSEITGGANLRESYPVRLEMSQSRAAAACRAVIVEMKACLSTSPLMCVVCVAVLGFQISFGKHDASPPRVQRLPLFCS